MEVFGKDYKTLMGFKGALTIKKHAQGSIILGKSNIDEHLKRIAYIVVSPTEKFLVLDETSQLHYEKGSLPTQSQKYVADHREEEEKAILCAESMMQQVIVQSEPPSEQEVTDEVATSGYYMQRRQYGVLGMIQDYLISKD